MNLLQLIPWARRLRLQRMRRAQIPEVSTAIEHFRKSLFFSGCLSDLRFIDLQTRAELYWCIRSGGLEQPGRVLLQVRLYLRPCGHPYRFSYREEPESSFASNEFTKFLSAIYKCAQKENPDYAA